MKGVILAGGTGSRLFPLTKVRTSTQCVSQEGALHYDVMTGWWTDAGTFESLQLASKLVHVASGTPAAVPAGEPTKRGRPVA